MDCGGAADVKTVNEHCDISAGGADAEDDFQVFYVVAPPDGASLAGFMRDIRNDAILTLTEEEKSTLKPILEAKPERKSPQELLAADDHLAACAACRETLMGADALLDAFTALQTDLLSADRDAPAGKTTGSNTHSSHPGVDTTPEEMARERPDLTTGELKMPVED